MNQQKSPRQPFHDFFQMLFGFSSINFLDACSKSSNYASQFLFAARRGKNNFCLSATRESLEPINCANRSFCCRNSAMTSGDGGENFSATIGVLSRIEKFTAKMKIQIAAKPAQAAARPENSRSRSLIESRTVPARRLSSCRFHRRPPKFPRAIRREFAATAGAKVFVQIRSFDFLVKWTQPLAQFV